MQQLISLCGAAAVMLMVSGAATTASADAHAADAPTADAPEADAPEASGPDSGVISDVDPATPPAHWAENDPDRYPDLDVPTKPWSYDTVYFFGLTRGLDDEPLSTWGRRASMVGTVPLDVMGLPGAALAGLFGS